MSRVSAALRRRLSGERIVDPALVTEALRVATPDEIVSAVYVLESPDPPPAAARWDGKHLVSRSDWAERLLGWYVRYRRLGFPHSGRVMDWIDAVRAAEREGSHVES